MSVSDKPCEVEGSVGCRLLGNDKCDLDSTVAILTFSLLLQDLRAADIKVGLCFRQIW